MLSNIQLKKFGFILTLMLMTLNFVMSPAVQGQTVTDKPNDEARVLQSLVLRFLDACLKDDKETINALSPPSPEGPIQIESERVYETDARILLEGSKFPYLNIQGTKATLRIIVIYAYKDEETGNTISEPFSYNFSLRKFNDEWKVLTFNRATHDFIATFLSAKDFAAEASLLKQEQALLKSAEAGYIVRYIWQNRDEENEKKLDRLLKFIAEQGENPLVRAEALWVTGNNSIQDEKYNRALAKFRESLDAAGKANSKRMLANANAAIGETYIYLKDEQQGQTYQALGKSLYLKDPKDTFKALRAESRFGNAYYNTKHFAKAAEIYLRGVKLAQDSNDKEWEAYLISNTGDCYRELQKYSAAQEAYLNSLALINSLPDKPVTILGVFSVWDIYNSLAINSLEQRDFSTAENYYSLAQGMAVQNKSAAGIISSHTGLAQLYFQKGDKVRALKAYNLLLDRLFEIGEVHQLAKQLGEITGEIAVDSGEVKLSKEFLEQGLQKYGRNFSQRDNASLLLSQVMIAFIKGDVIHIGELCQKVLRIEEAEDMDKIIVSMILSLVSIFQNQNDAAIKTLERAEFIARHANEIEMVDLVILIKAMLTLGLEEEKEEEEDLQKQIAYLEKTVSEMSDSPIRKMAYIFLGGAYLASSEKGNNKESRAKGVSYLKESITTSDPDDPMQPAISMLASLLLSVTDKEAGRYQEAINNLAEAKRQMENYGMLTNLLWGLEGLEAEMHLALGQKPQAKASFAKAIESLEKMGDKITGGAIGKIQFFANFNDLYKAFIKFLIDEGETEESLLYAERAKARTLRDFNPQAPPPKWNKYKDWFPGIIMMMPDESTNNVTSPETSSSKSFISAPFQNFEETKDLLPDKQTAILEYVVMADKTYLFVLTADDGGESGNSGNPRADGRVTASWRMYPINFGKSGLAPSVAKLNDLIINNRSGYATYCQILYTLLLKPAEAQLAGKSSLIIIPDSFLWNLPFQALQPEPDRFLLEGYNISYAPSLSILKQVQKLRRTRVMPPLTRAQKDVLVMGNPSDVTQVFDLNSSGQSFPFSIYEQGTAGRTEMGTNLYQLKPLRGAANEVNKVSNFYGNEVEKLIGPKATKAEFQRIAERYRIIHFATHGILNSKRPMESSIVLGPERPERANNRSKINTNGKSVSDKPSIVSSDQLLSAREVMEMRLQAELVVLSACDTAGGGISEGEGMIGLTWAFAAAGVPTIVASQWAVPDTTTADLMEDFHQRLQRYSQKNRSIGGTAAALTEAARAIAGKREYRHPYYWAAFIVVGNGQ